MMFTNGQVINVSCEISQGMFDNERSVMLHIGDKKFGMLLDRSVIHDGTIQIKVISVGDSSILIELPGETLSGGKRHNISKRNLESLFYIN